MLNRSTEPGRRGSRQSVFHVWFKSFSLLLVLFFALFIAITKFLIFTRADRTTLSLLDRALTITWEEYNQFFQRNTHTLQLLTGELDLDARRESLARLQAQDPAIDFWIVTGPDGTILASSAEGDARALEPLVTQLGPVWQTGTPVNASEVISIDDLRAFSPALGEKALIRDAVPAAQAADVLCQVAAVPYRQDDGQIGGVVLVGHVVNNDNSMAERLHVTIPDSYSTISLSGVRIAGNISSELFPSYVGETQLPQHIETISRGERYYGRHRLAADLDHLVVSDPIRNSAGQVVGALTIGHPLEGLASLKEDMALWIYLSALLCWTVALVASLFAGRYWAMPLKRLSTIAKRISRADGITEEHVAMFDHLPPGNTVEMDDLQTCLRQMASALYEKTQEVRRYLSALQIERNELKRMAAKLREVNATLEIRVEERTRELRATLKDLAASSVMKSKLLANTSHELRTPLNSIIGFSDMLTRGVYGPLTDAQADRVRIIGDSARYLRKLIDDLLEMSLVHQGKLVLEPRWVEIDSLVESVVSMFRDQEDKVTISTEIEPGLPAIWVDPVRIKQVLYNLLTNAIKFTPEAGEVRCVVRREGGELLIQVQDNGVGISEEEQPYVFDEFFQAENQGFRKEAGFGLGLPLSKELVQLHGGRITLYSPPGEGTTISVYLPLTEPAASEAVQ